LIGTNYFLNYLKLNQAQTTYNSSIFLPGPALIPTYLDQQSKKNALSRQESTTKLAYSIFISFWLWNIYDAATFERQDGFQFWEFSLQQRTTSDLLTTSSKKEKIETYGSLQFQIRF
jgi:hypothetical protein